MINENVKIQFQYIPAKSTICESDLISIILIAIYL